MYGEGGWDLSLHLKAGFTEYRCGLAASVTLFLAIVARTRKDAWVGTFDRFCVHADSCISLSKLSHWSHVDEGCRFLREPPPLSPGRSSILFLSK